MSTSVSNFSHSSFILCKKGNTTGGFLKLEHLELCVPSHDHLLCLQGAFRLILVMVLWVFDLLAEDTFFFFLDLGMSSTPQAWKSFEYWFFKLFFYLYMGIFSLFIFFSPSRSQGGLILHVSPQCIFPKLRNFLDLFKESKNTGEKERMRKGFEKELGMRFLRHFHTLRWL